MVFRIFEKHEMPHFPERLGRVAKYPWGDLEIGKGFYVSRDDAFKRDGTQLSLAQLQKQLWTTGAAWSKRQTGGKAKFAAKIEKHSNGVWVIRTK